MYVLVDSIIYFLIFIFLSSLSSAAAAAATQHADCKSFGFFLSLSSLCMPTVDGNLWRCATQILAIISCNEAIKKNVLAFCRFVWQRKTTKRRKCRAMLVAIRKVEKKWALGHRGRVRLWETKGTRRRYRTRRENNNNVLTHNNNNN